VHWTNHQSPSAPTGAWVVLFDHTGIWRGNVPDDLSKVFDNATKQNLTDSCVCFTTTGTSMQK